MHMHSYFLLRIQKYDYSYKKIGVCSNIHNDEIIMPFINEYSHWHLSNFLLVKYVTQSDKTSLIAQKYTRVYNGIYLLFCVCYSNSVSFIELLRIFCIHGKVCAKILCSEKELLNLKDSKLTQNFYGNKTGFVRPGHIFFLT